MANWGSIQQIVPTHKFWGKTSGPDFPILTIAPNATPKFAPSIVPYLVNDWRKFGLKVNRIRCRCSHRQDAESRSSIRQPAERAPRIPLLNLRIPLNRTPGSLSYSPIRTPESAIPLWKPPRWNSRNPAPPSSSLSVPECCRLGLDKHLLFV